MPIPFVELSVVVPVRNEAGNIRPLLQEIVAAIPWGMDWEILYVDDGSTDETRDELRAAQAAEPRLRVIRHTATAGQSAALWTGITRARGEWVVTLDGDGQNDPADIRRLWELTLIRTEDRPIGLVAGRREKRNDSYIRCVASRIANGVRRSLLNDDSRDTGCGLKLMRREALLAMPFFDHMHRFLPALFRNHGWAVATVGVNHRPRLTGRSKYGIFDRLWVGIVDLFGVMWLLRRSVVPTAIEEDTP